jgi:hypothetical protein
MADPEKQKNANDNKVIPLTQYLSIDEIGGYRCYSLSPKPIFTEMEIKDKNPMLFKILDLIKEYSTDERSKYFNSDIFKTETSTLQASISTPKASISTPKASISTPQASTSTPQASTSTSQANISTLQASTSTPQTSISTPQGIDNLFEEPTDVPTVKSQFIKRNLQPCVISSTTMILGPKGSGKATYAKMMFPNYLYVSLANERVYDLISENLATFLLACLNKEKGVIIDDGFKIPRLVGEIKHMDDCGNKKYGFYVILEPHSNDFDIQCSIQRCYHYPMISHLYLLPLSLFEIKSTQQNLDKLLITGFYPVRLTASQYPEWFDTYIKDIYTYIKPYLSKILKHNSYKEVSEEDRDTMRKFETYTSVVYYCAKSIGKNLHEIKNNIKTDCKIKGKIVSSWLDVLQTMYIISQIDHKLYFVDVGIACYLLNIKNEIDCLKHPFRTVLFENMIISELQKILSGARYNIEQICRHKGKNYLVVKISGREISIIIKPESDINWTEYKQFADCCVIYLGDVSRIKNQVYIISWKHLYPVFYNYIKCRTP